MAELVKEQIISHPKKKDLFIPGELIKIEVHFNSFSFYFQLPGMDRFEHQLCVFKRTLPIESLTAFFKENGKHKPGHCTIRPHFKPTFTDEFSKFFITLGFKTQTGNLGANAKWLISTKSYIEASIRSNNQVQISFMDEGDRCPIIALQKIDSVKELRAHLKNSENLFFHKELYDRLVNHNPTFQTESSL